MGGVSHWNSQSRAITNARVKRAGFQRWFLALVDWCRYFSYSVSCQQKSVMFIAVTVVINRNTLHVNCVKTSVVRVHVGHYCPVNDL